MARERDIDRTAANQRHTPLIALGQHHIQSDERKSRSVERRAPVLVAVLVHRGVLKQLHALERGRLQRNDRRAPLLKGALR